MITARLRPVPLIMESRDHPRWDARLSRRIGTLGKNVIKIKYFGSRFTADIRITHAIYVLRLASKPPSGYRASFRSGYPYLEQLSAGLAFPGRVRDRVPALSARAAPHRELGVTGWLVTVTVP